MDIRVKCYGPYNKEVSNSFLPEFYQKCALTPEYFLTYTTHIITSPNIFISTLTIYIVDAYIITYMSISK